MKIFNLFLFIICLIFYINSTCEPDEENNKIRGKSDCINRAFSDDEISRNAYKCCYMKYEIGDNEYYNCAPLTLNDYYDIKTKISSLESAHGIDIKKLYCNSSYVYASLFLILIFLL